MAVSSPLSAGFNNGEISPFMYGRVGAQKYRLSLRECTNMYTLVQGPATKRDGSRFVVPVADESVSSRFFKFEFNAKQGYVVELSGDVFRFFTNRGVVVETAKSVTAITQADPAVVTAASHGFSDGDQIKFTAVGPYHAFQNRVFTVAGKTTDTFQLSGFDGTDLPDFSGSPKVARIYSVASPYDAADIDAVTGLHSADVLTLMHSDYAPRKLARNGATDWTVETFEFKDGPYLTEDTKGTTLTPSERGSLTPLMTSDTAPSGQVLNDQALDTAWAVFDGNPATSAVGGANTAAGSITYVLDSGSAVVDHYWVQAPARNDRIGQTPVSWYIEGSDDGTTWVVLDRQTGQTGWAASEVRFYSFSNDTAFKTYRFRWGAVDGSGDNIFRLAELSFGVAGKHQTAFTLTASAKTGINNGDGFQATDVGRSIRLMGSDGQWRWASIDSVTSTTAVKIKMYGQALPDLSPIKRWRLGLFSDTTGWPSCGAFFQNRQIFAGPKSHPNIICCSMSGVYDTFSPSEEDGTVTDASGFTYPLLEQQVTSINWLHPLPRGVVIGTAEGEGILAPTNSSLSKAEPMTAKNAQVIWPTNYGSAPINPQPVDTALLFVDRRRKRVREMSYQLSNDTFVAPDMNAWADHITQNGGIERCSFQRHPHRILWSARADGRLLGFSYDRGEDVTGWHSHAIGGDGKVEDLCIISSPDGQSEDLWLEVKRTINGATRRYVEYIGDWFWHDTKQEDACFMDAAVVYSGAATDTVYGLAHLEGATVRVFADGSQAQEQTVSGGSITIPVSAKKIIVGLGYKAKLWTLRPEGGSATGTAQGKMKRIYRYVLRLYRSLGGKIGDGLGHLNTLPYWGIQNSVTQPLDLFSNDIGPLSFPGGYELDGGTVIENDTAYPFTVIAYMPSMVTVDAA